MTHIEAFANAVVGLLIAQGILWLWGMSGHEALVLNVIMFVVSYLRSFLIRMTFRKTDDRLEGRGWRGWG